MRTLPGDGSVADFLAGIEDEERRRDCQAVVALMQEVTGETPTLWGPGMIGFGSYHYRYDSGREGDWFVTGVSPRKQALTLYIMSGFDRHDELMARLGRYRTGTSCLYVNRLADIDIHVLRELVAESVAWTRERWGA